VKLIKGRLPMDPDAMHRRWLRLPPAIRDHPMWAGEQAPPPPMHSHHSWLPRAAAALLLPDMVAGLGLHTGLF
jgi:hypothetical protein